MEKIKCSNCETEIDLVNAKYSAKIVKDKVEVSAECPKCETELAWQRCSLDDFIPAE